MLGRGLLQHVAGYSGDVLLIVKQNVGENRKNGNHKEDHERKHRALIL